MFRIVCSMIAGACAIAAGPMTTAELRVFDNRSERFNWIVHQLFDSQTIIQALDPTLDPEQSGAVAGPGLGLAHYDGLPEPDGLTSVLVGVGGLQWALVKEDFAPVPFNIILRVPRTFAPGETVDAGDGPFVEPPARLTLAFEGSSIEPSLIDLLNWNSWVDAPTRLLFIPGSGFVGIRFTAADGEHFGWLEIEAEFAPNGDLVGFTPVRWAYETTPGAPALVVARSCPEDADGDGAVGPVELLGLLAAWGARFPRLDIDGNGSVGPGDLLAVLAAFGDCSA